MKILLAASECVPFIKTGGLADVVGALSPVLAQRGEDVRVILPLYSAIPEKWQSQMKLTNVVSLNEFMESGSEVAGDSSMGAHFQSPEEVMGNTELKEMLMEALDLLTEKERSVILFYYYEELTLKEISNVLEVSESRVSQLHIKALKKMKEKLGKYMGYLTDVKN